MRKVLIISLILSLLLSSCSIDWNDEKDKKIAELEKQIQDDTFKKKQECMKYKDEMLVFAKKYYKINEYNSKIEITEIFYSVKNNSCYFVTVLDEGKNKFKSIFDFYGQKLDGQNDYYNDKEINKEITVLKGE